MFLKYIFIFLFKIKKMIIIYINRRGVDGDEKNWILCYFLVDELCRIWDRVDV